MQAVVLAKNGSSAESRVTDSLEVAGLEERAIRFTAGNQRSRNVWYTRNLCHYVKLPETTCRRMILPLIMRNTLPRTD